MCTELNAKLQNALRGAKKIIVLGIGSKLYDFYHSSNHYQDDLGLRVANAIKRVKINDLTVFIADTAPENFTSLIRRERPSHVVLIDAVEMNAPPGDIDIIDIDKIRGKSYSTHSLPLSILSKYIEATIGAKLIFIGIQRAHQRHPHDKINVQSTIDKFVTLFKNAVEKVRDPDIN
jgi:hydrogenase 3 maturation protease